MSGKPLDQLLEQTDPEGCHLTELPSRIWVFGGPCQNKADGPALSLRDAFWRQSMEEHPAPAWFANLDRPEDHSGWLEHSGYSDLLEFERDACYLAKATILFAESPGAHAELGAIAIDAVLLHRLAVILEHQYTQGKSLNSFLYLGPLRRVRTQGCLCVINDNTTQFSSHDFNAIVDALNQWLPTAHKKEKLQPGNPTHRLLLLADLVDILLISSEPDLTAALAHFNVQMHINELKKSLKLLNFLKFVAIHESGITPYWLRHDSENGPWVDYTSNSSEMRFDRARFKFKSIKLINDNNRLRPIYERGRR